MDPGTAVGIISLGLALCQGLFSYYESYKGWGEDVVLLCQFIQGTKTVLKIVQGVLDKRQQDESVAAAIKDQMQRCSEIYKELHKILDKISQGTGKDGVRSKEKSIWTRVKYPLKTSLIVKLCGFLHEHEQHLNILLQALHIESTFLSYDLLSKIGNKLDNISMDVNEVDTKLQVIVDNWETSKRNTSDSNILQWLCPLDICSTHDAAQIKMEPGTGKWLLKGSEFCRWKASGSLMWVNGEIGRGKTILCSAVIEDLKSVCAADKSSRLAYFYFTFRDTQTQSIIACLSSILRQICSGADLPQELRTLYHNCEKESCQEPKLSSIMSILASVIQQIDKVFVVFDALDECPDTIDGGCQRSQVLKWILDFLKRCPNLKILFTSRNDPGATDVADVIRSHPTLIDVSVDATKTYDDIRLYLTRQFYSDQKLRKMNEIANRDIPSVLQDNADGMFQWVSCQLDALKSVQLVRLKSVNGVLSTLPKTLDGVYMRILNSIDSDSLAEVINALRWLSFSLQPMTVGEINEACIINPNSTAVISDDDRMLPQDLLRLLQGLVTTRPFMRRVSPEVDRFTHYKIVPRSFMQNNEEEEHIELCLSHVSVKAFLTFDSNRNINKYGFESKDAHATIASRCIAYIFYYSSSLAKSTTKQDLKLFPMLYYACRFWFEHVRLAGEKGRCLTPRIIQLLQSVPVWTDCLLIYHPYRLRFHTSNTSLPKLASALGWAAVLGLDLVVESLLDDGNQDINAHQDEDVPRLHIFEIFHHSKGVEGTALAKAAAFGHDSVVRVLIDRGASVDYVALNAACRHWREDIFDILLDAIDNGNALQRENGAALLGRAVRCLNQRLATALLKRGADPNGFPEPAISPLIEAAKLQNLGMCKLLVEHNADINRCSDDALYYALTNFKPGTQGEFESSYICRLFVQKGVSLNRILMKRDRPLAFAIYNGWEDVANLMIAKGAEIEPNDGDGMHSGYLLQAAVRSGNTNLVEMLLATGIHVDAPSTRDELYVNSKIKCSFPTPLHAAAYYINLDAVELLLQWDPNTNSPGEPYHSPLGALAAGVMTWSSCSPEDAVLEAKAAEAIYLLLMEKGADLVSAKALCKDKEILWALQKMGDGTLLNEIKRRFFVADSRRCIGNYTWQ